VELTQALLDACTTQDLLADIAERAPNGRHEAIRGDLA
jgi:hypothetical protein